MNNTNWIDRQEYPFDSHFYQVPAGRMHYVDQGSGPAVVMVHGNPTWSCLYRHMIKQLQPEHRCIAVLKSKPTLIVWGMKDIAFREKELKRWEAMFPKAQSVRLSSVGHFVQEEAPDELAAAAVLFLHETDPA